MVADPAMNFRGAVRSAVFFGISMIVFVVNKFLSFLSNIWPDKIIRH